MNWLHNKATNYRKILTGEYEHFVSSSDEDDKDEDGSQDSDHNGFDIDHYFKHEDFKYLKINKGKSVKKSRDSPTPQISSM